ncbi:hypothetical protein HDU97_005669 [Phlyctochytrium planicorne]|nr:hypothetical protein HDU97_005669 [Phlyctochytrium planicorne]
MSSLLASITIRALLLLLIALSTVNALVANPHVQQEELALDAFNTTLTTGSETVSAVHEEHPSVHLERRARKGAAAKVKAKGKGKAAAAKGKGKTLPGANNCHLPILTGTDAIRGSNYASLCEKPNVKAYCSKGKTVKATTRGNWDKDCDKLNPPPKFNCDHVLELQEVQKALAKLPHYFNCAAVKQSDVIFGKIKSLMNANTNLLGLVSRANLLKAQLVSDKNVHSTRLTEDIVVQIVKKYLTAVGTQRRMLARNIGGVLAKIADPAKAKAIESGFLKMIMSNTNTAVRRIKQHLGGGDINDI